MRATPHSFHNEFVPLQSGGLELEMDKGKYSITRSRATWKPRTTEDEPPLFSCSQCKSYCIGFASNERAIHVSEGRSPVIRLPFSGVSTPQCCGESMNRTQYLEIGGLSEDITVDFSFLGGFNNNALKIMWFCKPEAYHVSWVLLMTFTGMQLKYVLPASKPHLLFAFADEDAYAYCDKSPCEECVFRCKRGFVAYIHVEELGVVRMPLNRMAVIGSRYYF